MMTVISYLIIVLNIVLVTIGIPVYLHRIKQANLVYSKGEFWFFEIFSLFFSILHFWILQSEKQHHDVGLLITIVACIGLITWLHYVIQFDESGFWVINLLWQKKRYEYQDVLLVKRKKLEYRRPRRTENVTIIHFPNKKIFMNRNYENYFEFMEKMAKKYKEVHGHKLASK